MVVVVVVVVVGVVGRLVGGSVGGREGRGLGGGGARGRGARALSLVSAAAVLTVRKDHVVVVQDAVGLGHVGDSRGGVARALSLS